MPGLASIAMGSAPLVGGALLGVAAGNMKGPDVRGLIKADLDLLERIPADQTQRRAELQRTIDDRIDDLVVAADRSRALRAAATAYAGNWRDIVLFVCAVLFTIVWWNVKHTRADWLTMFIALIVLTIIAGLYAARGLLRTLGGPLRRRARKTSSGTPA